MSEVTVLFDPFAGPIKDQEGKLRIEPGRRASHDELWGMNWFVENIVGKLPDRDESYAMVVRSQNPEFEVDKRTE